jgi:excisionase family DNA binding protein
MDIECQTVSVAAAGRILGVSRNVAYQAVRTKQLPALRIGRQLRVPKALLERLLTSAPDNGSDGR